MNLKTRSILLALAILASASFSTLNANSKNDKKKKVEATEQTAQPVGQPVVLKTANDTLSYVSGMALTNGLMPFLRQNFGVSEADMPNVIAGFKDAIAKRKNPSMKAYHAGEQIAEMVNDRMLPGLQQEFTIGTDSLNEEMLYNGFLAALNNDTTYYTTSKAEKIFAEQRVAYKNRADSLSKQKNEAFLAENKGKEGVQTLPSGLQYKILKKGNGPIPKGTDKVQVVYEGKTIDGKVFDATSRHNGVKFDTFTPNNLIKGWQEALTLMPVGSKWELFVPYQLGYGERGAGREIGPYATLIFTMELKGIEDTKADTAKPATQAKTTQTAKPAKPANAAKPAKTTKRR